MVFKGISGWIDIYVIYILLVIYIYWINICFYVGNMIYFIFDSCFYIVMNNSVSCFIFYILLNKY